MTRFRAALCVATTLACAPAIASAHDVNALDHAPIGVMGDHRHAKGEWMIGYRYMHMESGGTQIDTDTIDPNTIVTTVPNRFAGMPGQPPTLRVVPDSMHMDMHMAGLMYGLSDSVTLMISGSYTSRDMDAVTYAGGMGTDVLGSNGNTVSGFGDIKAVALVGLTDDIHLNLGVSLPTGSITNEGTALSPMGMVMPMRLPYPMQSGSGTVDLNPGITWRGQSDVWGWGAQAKGTIRLGTNDEGYSLGDSAMTTAWIARSVSQGAALSVRLQAESSGRIDGIDPAIMGPVQAANPDYSGGERLFAYTGINTVATHGPLAGWRLGAEIGVPIVQDLNGPQMARDWMMTLGIQKSF